MNYDEKIHFKADCCQNFFQIKVVQNKISYQKVNERMCLYPQE